MSSPLDRDVDPDEPSPYAPKWVRDAAYAHRREAAAPRLPAAGESRQDRQTVPESPPAEGLVIDRYRVPRSLDPTLMPDPWPVQHAPGILARFAAAIVVATLVALLIVGKFPMPWGFAAKDHEEAAPSFGSRFAGQNARTAEQPKPPIPVLSVSQEAPRASGEAFPLGVSVASAPEGAGVILDGLATGSTVSAGRASGPNTWRIPVSDLRNAQVRPPHGYAGRMDLVVELRVAGGASVDRKLLRLEWAAAAPPAQTASFAFRHLDREEVSVLLKRGEDFIASGDLASARLVLQRAAEAGDPGAALRLAGTYDPIVLEQQTAPGSAVNANIAMARMWYERAKELGSADALRRLDLLVSRNR